MSTILIATVIILSITVNSQNYICSSGIVDERNYGCVGCMIDLDWLNGIWDLQGTYNGGPYYKKMAAKQNKNVYLFFATQIDWYIQQELGASGCFNLDPNPYYCNVIGCNRCRIAECNTNWGNSNTGDPLDCNGLWQVFGINPFESNIQFEYCTPDPTISPTSTTLPPSQYPSVQPTVSTLQPSLQPTLNTLSPSHLPSVSTLYPSFQPTNNPTIMPSIQPTILPTSQPTSQPTRQPTIEPTGQPTSQPTFIPTNTPSQQPTSPLEVTNEGNIPSVIFGVIINFVWIICLTK